MADAGDSKSPALHGRVGSTPTSGTTPRAVPTERKSRLRLLPRLFLSRRSVPQDVREPRFPLGVLLREGSEPARESRGARGGSRRRVCQLLLGRRFDCGRWRRRRRDGFRRLRRKIFQERDFRGGRDARLGGGRRSRRRRRFDTAGKRNVERLDRGFRGDGHVSPEGLFQRTPEPFLLPGRALFRVLIERMRKAETTVRGHPEIVRSRPETFDGDARRARSAGRFRGLYRGYSVLSPYSLILL